MLGFSVEVPDNKASPGPGVTDVTVPDVWFCTSSVTIPVPLAGETVIPELPIICLTPELLIVTLPVAELSSIPAPGVNPVIACCCAFTAIVTLLPIVEAVSPSPVKLKD